MDAAAYDGDGSASVTLIRVAFPEGFYVPGEGGQLVKVECPACHKTDWAKAPNVRLRGAVNPDDGVDLTPMICESCGHTMLMLPPDRGDPSQN